MQTKICSVCKKNKNIDQFRKSRGYWVSPCKSCRAKKQRKWYRKNKAKFKSYRQVWYARNGERHKHNVRTRTEAIKQELLKIKGTLTCSKCPESHIACLDFHHRDPTQKEFNINQAWRLGYSMERIKKELKKCDVLCSNCHRKLHWELGMNSTKLNRPFKNQPSYRQPRI
jgi:hypothetical protein